MGRFGVKWMHVQEVEQCEHMFFTRVTLSMGWPWTSMMATLNSVFSITDYICLAQYQL